MTVTSVSEIWDPARRGSINDLGERQETRSWLVKTDDPADTILDVQQAAGLPQLYDYSSYDPSIYVSNVAVDQDSKEPTRWIVTLTYMAAIRKSEVKWGTQKVTEYPMKDINDLPFLNSAFEKFDPPPAWQRTLQTLTLVRDETAYDPAMAVNFIDCKNSTVFLGYPVGQVKIEDITGDELFDRPVVTHRVTYVFHIKPETWTLKLLDAGYRGFDADDTGHLHPPKQFLDPRGSPYSQPCLLDGTGVKLAEGGTPVYLDFEQFPAVDFAPLAIVLP